MSLLLAEDEDSVGRTTVELFRRVGLRCEWVKSAHEVLVRLESSPPEVLITDIRMPGSDELGYLDDVRRRAPEMPVIVVTGYPTLPSAIAAIRHNVIEYLVKPAEFGVLRAAVEEALALRRTGRQLAELADSLERLSEVLTRETAGGVSAGTSAAFAAVQEDLARLRLHTKQQRWLIQGCSAQGSPEECPQAD